MLLVLYSRFKAVFARFGYLLASLLALLPSGMISGTSAGTKRRRNKLEKSTKSKEMGIK